MPNFDKLSEKDRAVLRSIFDPSLTIGEVAEEDDFVNDDDELPVSESERAARGLEARAVRAVEVGGAARGDALRLLDAAVAAAAAGERGGPGEARALNNRAQLLRLMGRDDDAMADLERALACEATVQRVRAQALCQRALLLRRRGDADAAKRDFSEAAGLGSAFAKKQVAEMNPYAALCNQMLQQVMKGETNPKIGDQS